jgi:flavin-dependent dehydrogenase
MGLNDECFKSLGGNPFQRIDLWGRKAQLWSTKQAVGGTGWIIPRAVLDQKLRDLTAGPAEIHYGSRVVDVTPKSGDALTLSVRQNKFTRESVYDAVILAGGSADPLSRKWGTSGQPEMGAALTAYLPRSAPRAPLFQFMEEMRPGYGWIFPASQESVNLGVCALSQNKVKNLRQLAAQFLLAWEIPASVKWRGGGGPLWSGRGSQWHHPAGIVSCGDAAGVVDPANGEGITAALLSGARAGMAVARFLQEGRVLQCLEEYSGWVKTYFARAYDRSPVRQLWAMMCGM